ncbi:MAG: hypothetical protein QI223_07850 [Candidatus Korarchaeota archaeon]|nr:hypothetical protein [Candidatus Korarchaeota archaeon]
MGWDKAYLTAVRIAFLIISWALLGLLVGFLLANPLAELLEPFIPFSLMGPPSVQEVARWLLRPTLMFAFMALFAVVGGMGALVKLTVDLAEETLIEEEERLAVEVLALSRATRRLEEEIQSLLRGEREQRFQTAQQAERQPSETRSESQV